MYSLSLTTKRNLVLLLAAWAVGIAAIAWVVNRQETVTVVHWANGHMMSPALLPALAEQFNREHNVTASGARIKVQPVLGNSGAMTEDIVQRVTTGTAINRNLANPTIVTPAADHWLGLMNHRSGRQVIDTNGAEKIATTSTPRPWWCCTARGRAGPRPN